MKAVDFVPAAVEAAALADAAPDMDAPTAIGFATAWPANVWGMDEADESMGELL
jgi:hypothetical protein